MSRTTEREPKFGFLDDACSLYESSCSEILLWHALSRGQTLSVWRHRQRRRFLHVHRKNHLFQLFVLFLGR